MHLAHDWPYQIPVHVASYCPSLPGGGWGGGGGGGVGASRQRGVSMHGLHQVHIHWRDGGPGGGGWGLGVGNCWHAGVVAVTCLVRFAGRFCPHE